MKFLILPLFFSILIGSVFATDVTINTKTLPNGTIDQSYSGVVRAEDGCAPYVWTIISGHLPVGLKAVRSKNTEYLDLSGKPTKEATFWFDVEVKDCKDHISKKAYTVKIQNSAEHVVDLHWKASTSNEIAGYNVYRGPNGKNWTKINAGLVGSTIFDDSTVSNGSTYYYAVTAVGISGDESKKTAAIKVVVP